MYRLTRIRLVKSGSDRDVDVDGASMSDSSDVEYDENELACWIAYSHGWHSPDRLHRCRGTCVWMAEEREASDNMGWRNV